MKVQTDQKTQQDVLTQLHSEFKDMKAEITDLLNENHSLLTDPERREK